MRFGVGGGGRIARGGVSAGRGGVGGGIGIGPFSLTGGAGRKNRVTQEEADSLVIGLLWFIACVIGAALFLALIVLFVPVGVLSLSRRLASKVSAEAAKKTELVVSVLLAIGGVLLFLYVQSQDLLADDVNQNYGREPVSVVMFVVGQVSVAGLILAFPISRLIHRLFGTPEENRKKRQAYETAQAKKADRARKKAEAQKRAQAQKDTPPR